VSIDSVRCGVIWSQLVLSQVRFIKAVEDSGPSIVSLRLPLRLQEVVKILFHNRL
jgi:hypothetical protein